MLVYNNPTVTQTAGGQEKRSINRKQKLGLGLSWQSAGLANTKSCVSFLGLHAYSGPGVTGWCFQHLGNGGRRLGNVSSFQQKTKKKKGKTVLTG